MCKQTTHTNKKLKFLTTKTSQKKTGIYLFMHTYAAQCAGVFRFCYIKIIQLRGADCASWVSFTYNRYQVSIRCQKY